MNIAYILPEFVTEKEAGGLATYYDNISRMLADAGNDITIIVQSDINEVIEYYPGIIVERVFVDLSKIDGDIPCSYIRTWSNGLKDALIRRMDNGENFDIVQYSNYMGYAVDRVDIPSVVRVSSFRPHLRAASQYFFDTNFEYKSIKAADFIEDIGVMKADIVYGPSINTALSIKNQTGKYVEIIESPYYPSCINNINNGFIKNLEEKKYIITFGTLKILKGAKLIGDCVYEILSRCSDLYWIFIGNESCWINDMGQKVIPSEYIKHKARKCGDRLIFMENQPKEVLFEFVKKSLFCVLPSRVDNLPNTCIEAMALGKVVIGTYGASFEQLIDDGKSGFLIERDNKEQLTECVCKVYGLDGYEMRKIGEKAKKRIKKMDSSIILKQLLNLYQKAIASYSEHCLEKDVYYRNAVDQYNKILFETKKTNIDKYLV